MRLIVLVLSFLISVCAFSGVIPLTGYGALPRGYDFGDPSPPEITPTGNVRIYTTGGYILSWNNSQSFLSGRPATLSALKLFHPGHEPFNEKMGEDIWDPTVRDGILYGGVMTPQKGRIFANEDDDSWSRRVYAFRKMNGKWVREPLPLSGPLPSKPTWIGHTYGHHFISDEQNQTYMFYEKVTEERNGLPWTTEIFARKMSDAFHLTGPEISILTLKTHWPATRRSFGGQLVEGPRPFKAMNRYFISFSAGDYGSDEYGMHLLVSQKITGPYVPYLTSNRSDLFHFGQNVEKNIPMTWGAARAAFFEMHGKWWTVFHGIKDDSDFNEKRNLWLAPVSIDRCGSLYCRVIVSP